MNLNILRYMDTVEPEEPVDMEAAVARYQKAAKARQEGRREARQSSTATGDAERLGQRDKRHTVGKFRCITRTNE